MAWRAATREERQLAWLWAASAAAAVALRPVWLRLAPHLPPCAFRALTGFPCPTCGSTHAALALLHGHPLEALRANPLATAAGLLFLLGGLAAPVWMEVRHTVPLLPTPLPLSVRVAALATLALGWIWVLAVWG
ncbi:MAG: DUF2752 domain-containing protein [Thermoanaerobaculaceae bacterium]|nr:DUF2752 domain-containing protein [Thermoanaerobaculaceae bacterium]